MLQLLIIVFRLEIINIDKTYQNFCNTKRRKNISNRRLVLSNMIKLWSVWDTYFVILWKNIKIDTRFFLYVQKKSVYILYILILFVLFSSLVIFLIYYFLYVSICFFFILFSLLWTFIAMSYHWHSIILLI